MGPYPNPGPWGALDTAPVSKRGGNVLVALLFPLPKATRTSPPRSCSWSPQEPRRNPELRPQRIGIGIGIAIGIENEVENMVRSRSRWRRRRLKASCDSCDSWFRDLRLLDHEVHEGHELGHGRTQGRKWLCSSAALRLCARLFSSLTADGTGRVSRRGAEALRLEPSMQPGWTSGRRSSEPVNRRMDLPQIPARSGPA